MQVAGTNKQDCVCTSCFPSPPGDRTHPGSWNYSPSKVNLSTLLPLSWLLAVDQRTMQRSAPVLMLRSAPVLLLLFSVLLEVGGQTAEFKKEAEPALNCPQADRARYQ